MTSGTPVSYAVINILFHGGLNKRIKGNAIVSFFGRHGNPLYNPLLFALGVLSRGLTDS